MKKILFVCSANKQRSKTAEDYFSEKNSNYEFRSAGTNHKICNKEGTIPLTNNLMEWADLVLVMEHRHFKIIKSASGNLYIKKIEILNIPDIYKYYQKELITILEDKTKSYLT